MTAYHQPVLLKESIEGLNIQASGTYVDATFGGGGHAGEILRKLGPHGKLYAFDQDENAQAQVPDDKRIVFTRGNFRFLENYLRYYGVKSVDGIIADLGVSSHHFDTPGRGFSYRFDSALDMRMNSRSSRTAAKIIAEYPEPELDRIFKNYGELHNSRKVTGSIAAARLSGKIETTGELVAVLQSCIPARQTNQYLSKVFQALRIEVNHEMESLMGLLLQSSSILHKGGRLAMISYHSLEDRLVKNYFRSGNARGIADKDVFGNFSVPFRSVNHRPIVPQGEELENNIRSRSAKLRVAEKN